MTLKEITNQLYDSSVAGYFNRQKMTRRQLTSIVSCMFKDGVDLAIKDTVVMEIALPDGWWYFTITRWGDGPDGFDYHIPDTREESNRIFQRLLDAGKARA